MQKVCHFMHVYFNRSCKNQQVDVLCNIVSFYIVWESTQDCLEQSGKKFCYLNLCFELLQNVDRIDRFIKNYAFVWKWNKSSSVDRILAKCSLFLTRSYLLFLWELLHWSHTEIWDQFEMLQFSVTLSPVEVLACKFCKEYFNGYLLEVSEVWNGYELLVVLYCASRSVYIEYKSLKGQATSGYIWQPIHNIYLTKYIP
jgi:hypothetical protein